MGGIAGSIAGSVASGLVSKAMGGGGGGSSGYTQGVAQATAFQKQSLAEQLKLGREAMALQQKMYEQALSLGEPYRMAGSRALGHYESMIYGIPLEETSGYRSAQTQAAQAAMGTPKTRQQLYDELKGQYATAGAGEKYLWAVPPSMTAGVLTPPQIVLGTAESPGEAGYKGATFRAGLQEKGWERLMPVSGAGGALDETGLNAAVDAAMAKQDADRAAATGAQTDMGWGDASQPWDWRTSPSYEFRTGEGIKALERGAAAQSGQLSGRQSKALERYGQEMATLEYDNILRRLGGLVDTGAAAAGLGAQQAVQTGAAQGGILQNMADLTAQTAGNVSSLNVAGGAARESAYLGRQAMGGGALGGFSNILQSFGGFGGGSSGFSFGGSQPYISPGGAPVPGVKPTYIPYYNQ